MADNCRQSYHLHSFDIQIASETYIVDVVDGRTYMRVDGVDMMAFIG